VEEVLVDANTGAVVGVEHEDADSDDEEDEGGSATPDARRDS
jgi:hypothetical protein